MTTKMYHTVAATTLDHHTHRFLWRDMNSNKEPDTYVIQRVSFGDKPSGAIATVALRKTAEMSKDRYPEATEIILTNTYMDDIIESVDTESKAKQLTDDIENLLEQGGFKPKEWIYSGIQSNKNDDLRTLWFIKRGTVSYVSPFRTIRNLLFFIFAVNWNCNYVTVN